MSDREKVDKEREESAIEVSPAAVATIEQPIRERAGMRIGRYRLMEQIGEGGMGTVWIAEQTEPVKRRVALKLIKAGMDSRQVLLRFEAERQALALMDHPNIAKVHDGGMTEAGRPYFVMELVKGAPITEYCDSARLPIPERLTLFVAVCQAVQHAHQKGVIHRDLKPSNILVCLYDGRPVPKVIDFGLAKAISQPLTEHTLYTAHGQMVGTPVYMSPEQAEFNNYDIDTRADIYSLGVILYELLTGVTPLDKHQFKNAAFQEMLRLIKEVEPPKPSTKISGSTGLPSVASQRGLEPAQLSKVMRGDLDWIVMKALEKDRTRRYETANGLARDIERHLHDEPIEASPPSATYRLKKLARRHRRLLAMAATIGALLVCAAAISTWMAIRVTRAEVASRESADNARLAAKAEKEAIERLFINLEAQDPDSKQGAAKFLQAYKKYYGGEHIDVLRVIDKLASAYTMEGRYAEALRLRKELVTLFKVKLGADHPETITYMKALAQNYVKVGEADEALRVYEEIRSLQVAKFGADHPDTISSMYSIASSYTHLGRRADAAAIYENILMMRKAKLGNDHSLTLLDMGMLATAYTAMDRHADALRILQEKLSIERVKLGRDHATTLASLNSVANVHHAMGQHDDGLRLMEEALMLHNEKFGPQHLGTLQATHNLASGYAKAGRFEEAIRLCHSTIEKWESMKVSEGARLYNISRTRALAAANMYSADQTESGAAKADAEARRAVESLEKAVAKGYRAVVARETEKDRIFEVLHGREDFQKLLATVKAGPEKNLALPKGKGIH